MHSMGSPPTAATVTGSNSLRSNGGPDNRPKSELSKCSKQITHTNSTRKRKKPQMATVVPFPSIRRRRWIERQIGNVASYRPEAAARYLKAR